MGEDRMIGGDSPVLDEERLRLLAEVLPDVTHEIGNHDQSVLLSGQLLSEIWADFKRIIDRYLAENGDFSAGGIPYSKLQNEVAGYLESIVRRTLGIEQLIAEVRALVSTEGGNDRQPVDLNRAIESSARLLASTIRKSTTGFSLVLAPDLPSVSGCPQDLSHAILRLFLWACRHLPERAMRFRVLTRREEQAHAVACEISVEDPGAKQPPASPSLDGPDTDAAEIDIVRRIIAAHGGTFELRQGPGRGVCAVICLPL